MLSTDILSNIFSENHCPGETASISNDDGEEVYWSPYKKLNECMLKAAQNGDKKLVQYLLTSENLPFKADPLYQKGHILQTACTEGRLEWVRFLLTSQDMTSCLNPNINGHQAFNLACSRGHMDIVRYMLTSPELVEPVNIHATGNHGKYTGFLYACSNGRLEVVRYLATSQELATIGHVDIHVNNDAALFYACANNQLAIVKYLLTSPEVTRAGYTHCNMQATDPDGMYPGTYAPLQAACDYKMNDVLHYLICEYRLPYNEEIQAICKHFPHARKMFESFLEKHQLEGLLPRKKHYRAVGKL